MDIAIVKRKLEKEKIFFFFTYDVWGHQEDLQRKAILNELVDFLIGKKAIESNTKKNNPKNWKERVKKVTGIVTETTQFQVPQISWGIFFCALILLIIPFCNQLAELDVLKEQQIPIIPVHLPLPVGIVLLPLILLVVLYFFFIDYKCRLNDKFKPSRKIISDASAELLCVYKDEKIETTERTYVNEVNPSVMDFRNLLKALSEELGKQHLVIFFDNMDRLPKEKVENLWSSIHTFFAEKQGYRTISCIVSFDRRHVRSAFSSNDGFDENCGDDYIDKTFDVVYRVAPPVLSDWKKFFKTKWFDAFGGIENQEEYDCVIQAYDLLSGKRGLTPRTIIKFINEFVLLKTLFSDVPERYIAIFILKKNELIENSLDKDCLKNLKSIYEKDDNYDKYIAALVYQVTPERALSAVYVTSLKRALEQGNRDELERISKASFFSDILDEAIYTVDKLDNTIVSIDMLPQESLDETRLRKVWKDLFKKADEGELAETSAGRLFGVMKKSQEVLLKHVDEKSRVLLISNLMTPFRKSGYNWEGYTPNRYVQLIKKFNEYISLDKLVKLLPKLKIQPNVYLEILKAHGEILKMIPFACDGLETYLAGLNFTQLLSLDCLSNLPDETKNHLNAEASLNNLFAQNQVYSEINFSRLLKLYEAFPKCKMNPNVINWNLLGQLLSSTQKSDIKGVILAIRLINCNHSIASHLPFDTMLKSSLHGDVKNAMLGYLASHMSVEEMLVNEQMLNTYGVVRGYVKERIALGDYDITGSGLFKILPKISMINGILAIDLTPLYSKMLEFYESKKDVFKRILDAHRDNPQNVERVLPKETLDFVVQHTSEFSKELVQWLVSYFDSWSKDVWIERIGDQSQYGVKEALIIKYNWSLNAKEAIEAHLMDVVNGAKPIPKKAKRNGIIESLDDNFKEHLFKNIRDKFRRGQAEMRLDLFIFLGDWLLKYGFVQQYPGDVLRTMIPSFLLENDSAAQIIADHFDLIKSFFDEETESKDWLKKAEEIANSRENYPLKGLIA